jgi:hypothetical protein
MSPAQARCWSSLKPRWAMAGRTSIANTTPRMNPIFFMEDAPAAQIFNFCVSSFPILSILAFKGFKGLDASFVVRDRDGQKLAYVYFEEEPGRRSAAKFTDLLLVL